MNPLRLPESRSRYDSDPDLDLSTRVSPAHFPEGMLTSADLGNQYPEPYKTGQVVYHKGARGIDPKPYKIHKILGDGQYELSRDGKCDHKVYLQEKLQLEP